jgi:hypothetical protein
VLLVSCAGDVFVLQGLSAQHYHNELAAADQLLVVSHRAGMG